MYTGLTRLFPCLILLMSVLIPSDLIGQGFFSNEPIADLEIHRESLSGTPLSLSYRNDTCEGATLWLQYRYYTPQMYWTEWSDATLSLGHANPWFEGNGCNSRSILWTSGADVPSTASAFQLSLFVEVASGTANRYKTSILTRQYDEIFAGETAQIEPRFVVFASSIHAEMDGYVDNGLCPGHSSHTISTWGNPPNPVARRTIFLATNEEDEAERVLYVGTLGDPGRWDEVDGKLSICVFVWGDGELASPPGHDPLTTDETGAVKLNPEIGSFSHIQVRTKLLYRRGGKDTGAIDFFTFEDSKVPNGWVWWDPFARPPANEVVVCDANPAHSATRLENVDPYVEGVISELPTGGLTFSSLTAGQDIYVGVAVYATDGNLIDAWMLETTLEEIAACQENLICNGESYQNYMDDFITMTDPNPGTDDTFDEVHSKYLSLGSGWNKFEELEGESQGMTIWMATLRLLARYGDVLGGSDPLSSVRLVGMSISAAYDMESGWDMTRPKEAAFFNTVEWATTDRYFAKDHPIYTSACFFLGVLSRGGSFYDNFRAVGSLNRGAITDTESGDFFQMVQGTEYRALSTDLGSLQPTFEVSFEGDPSHLEQLDGRPFDVSTRGVAPALVGFLVASQGVALVDNAVLAEDPSTSPDPLEVSVNESEQKRAGYLHDSVGTLLGLATRYSGSRLNVGKAVGGQTMLSLDEHESKASSISQGEREGSTVDLWTGIRIEPLVFPNRAVEMLISNAVLIWSQEVGELAGHGSPVRFLPAPGSHPTSQGFFEFEIDPDNQGRAKAYDVPIESRATLVTMDSVVLGDGRSDRGIAGLDTDKTTIYGSGLHLTARSRPPRFSTNTAPSDRVGLLYFHLDPKEKEAALRLSVPVSSSKKISSSAAIAWLDLDLDDDGLLDYSSLSDKNFQVFLPPRIAVVSLGRPQTTRADLTLTLSGFPTNTSAFARLAPKGIQRSGATSWVEASSFADPDDDGDFQATFEFSPTNLSDGYDGAEPEEGQVMEILVIQERTPTRQRRWAGASVRLPAVSE